MNNKCDELFLLTSQFRDYRDCSIFCLTETWLNSDIPNSSVCPPGFAIHRGDRSTSESNKTKGGGVCFLINERWCVNSTVVDKFCTPDIETVSVQCRPYYLPREFSSVLVVGVYIPNSAPGAVSTLTNHILALENKYPDSLVIVLGDFNQTSLTKEMPRYKQQIKCPTHVKNNILDHCYLTIKDAYHAISRPPLGLSDHNMIYLVPKYRQKIKSKKPVVRAVKSIDSESIQNLQNCLDNTDWCAIRSVCTDTHEFAHMVTSYVKFCQDMCIPEKTVKCFDNNKPWFNCDVKAAMKEQEQTFKSEDKDKKKIAKYNVINAIKKAKRDYSGKLEDKFANNDTRSVWQGLQAVTNYKQKTPSPIDSGDITPDKLNEFYARFDRLNHTAPPTSDSAWPLPPAFKVDAPDVNKQFRRQNIHKAPGPDGILTSTLKHCANQLAPVFTDIFNDSLCTQIIPSCFKHSTIVPVPKKAHVITANDYRPVALTSVVMKVFERIVQRYLQSKTDKLLDPFQFAYRANRCVEDAVSLMLHNVLTHLDSSNTYARLLFIDFSSAFNTIIPSKLFDKLLNMSLEPSICHWLLDFLLDRPQRVKFNGLFSDVLVLNTGAPQGCVLSPLLYSLFTNDCASTHDSVKMCKFADDTTVAGLITNGDESTYQTQVSELVEWCDNNNLLLNASKTKEIIVDFRKKPTIIHPTIIKGAEIEQTDSFKFLGTFISENLKWEENISATLKKANQRLYFLRQLKKYNMKQDILVNFYRSVIESILTFSIIVWFEGITLKQKLQLNRIVNTASKIIGCSLPTLEDIHLKRVKRRSEKIIKDSSHPANHLFKKLPSGRRFRTLKCGTTRSRKSFFPCAIQTMNE